MRVLIAPDKFKGTLDALDVAAALETGWRRANPGAEIERVPVADGGDGTLETLVDALGGEVRTASVTGPLGKPVKAAYGLVPTPEGTMGVVEMARASGLVLIEETGLDPLRATTYGTGELMLAACEHGVGRLAVCIGGSATNDAGAGMAQALGVRLLDEAGEDIGRGGAVLERLATIDVSTLDASVRGVQVTVACDVDNPLTGPHGAAAVYGPQKGCGLEEVALLDRALVHFAAVVQRDLGLDLGEVPGAGAAGGLGGGLVAFLGARLRPGFEVVAEALRLDERVEQAEVVVTGEGRYDRQTERGKAPAGVLDLARASGRRTVLVAGQVEEGMSPPADLVFSLEERAGLAECMARPMELLEEAAADAARAIEGT